MIKTHTSTFDTGFDIDRTILTQGVVHSLNSSLSKTSKRILITLYQSPHITQKVLAANVQTSPSSLGNIISRMKNIIPQLLVSERTGRIVFYSLSSVAELYVTQELLTKASDNTDPFIVHLSDDSLTNDTLRLLFQFQSTAGSSWETILDNLLYEHDSIDNHKKNDLYNIYTNLINNMIKLRIQNRISSLQKIDAILKNSILISRMKQFLDNTLAAYFDLAPLFEFEKQQGKNETSRFIDNIFEQVNRGIHAKYNIEFPVTEEQYRAIFNRIQIMIHEFSNKFHGNRYEALKIWAKDFFPSDDSASLNFIAYNCSIIYFKEANNRFSRN